MKTIIIGCGRIGSGLALKLNQSAHDITVIDQDPLTFKHLGAGFKGKTIAGVGFDRESIADRRNRAGRLAGRGNLK